jgi:hypothetical protein
MWVKQKSLCFPSGDRIVQLSFAVCRNFTSPRDFPQPQTPLFLHLEQQGHNFRKNNIRLCFMIVVVLTGEWQVPMLVTGTYVSDRYLCECQVTMLLPGTYCVLNCVKLTAILTKLKICKTTFRPFTHLILVLDRYSFIKNIFVLVLTFHSKVISLKISNICKRFWTQQECFTDQWWNL